MTLDTAIFDDGDVSMFPVKAFKTFFDAPDTPAPRYSAGPILQSQGRGVMSNAPDAYEGATFDDLMTEAERTLEDEATSFPRQYFHMKRLLSHMKRRHSESDLEPSQ